MKPHFNINHTWGIHIWIFSRIYNLLYAREGRFMAIKLTTFDFTNVDFMESKKLYSSILYYRESLINNKKTVEIKPVSKRIEVPIWHRTTLSLEEAAEYTGIGIHKLRELADMRGCKFVLQNGNRRRIKRQLLDEFLENSEAI